MSLGRPNNIVCILGMHRSGTSCLTGSLQEYGLSLGEHHTWNPYNLKGNRENQDVVDFHDQLLADNNGSWDQPPKKVLWQDKHFEQARKILQDHASEDYWGFKDPRCALAYEGWLSLCPDIKILGIFRNPAAVARSLDNRGGHSPTNAFTLWKTYNKRLLKLYKQRPFPLLNFDWEASTFTRQVDHFAQELGLAPSLEGSNFYTEDLKNNSGSTSKLPWSLKHTYKQLLNVSQLYKNA
jgi:hypothetical protein